MGFGFLGFFLGWFLFFLFVGFFFWWVGWLFQMKCSQEEADLTKDRPNK